MKVILRDKWGAYIECKHGFSWTTLLFGCITPLTRGDFKWTAIMGLSSMATFTLSNIVFAFLYNEKYIQEKLSEGYKPVDEKTQEFLIRNGYMFDKVDFDPLSSKIREEGYKNNCK